MLVNTVVPLVNLLKEWQICTFTVINVESPLLHSLCCLLFLHISYPTLSSHRTNRLQKWNFFVRPFRLESHVPTRISQWPTRHLWRNIHRFTTDPYLWFRLRRLQWWQGGWFHIGNNRKSKKNKIHHNPTTRQGWHGEKCFWWIIEFVVVVHRRWL